MESPVLKHVICILMYVFIVGSLYAQTEFRPRTLSLDSRYFFQSYSNKTVGHFGTEILQLAGLPADLLIKTNQVALEGEGRSFLFYSNQEARQVGNGILKLLTSALLTNGYTFAYHEYGHGTRVASVGLRPFYGHGSIQSEEDYLFAISGAVKLYDDFSSYFLASLFNTGGYTLNKPDDFLFPLREDLFDIGWESLIAAGGMNNEMLFSEYIEEEISLKGGHIGHLIPYLSGKLSATSYSRDDGIFNDLSNTVRLYQDRGIDITDSDITRGSWLAFFGSAYTYQFAWNFINIFRGKDHQIKAWKVKGIELPNTSFYMNIPGLSLKIHSAYNYKDWRFPISFETIIKGESQSEISIKVQRTYNQFAFSMGPVIGRKFEMEADVDYRINNFLGLSAGYTLYNRHNLSGQRNIPELENRDNDHEAYVRISLLY